MAVSDADILAYVQANINDPGAIAAAAAQYGVSLDDLTRATGYSAPEVNNYFSQANIDTSNLVARPVEPPPMPEPVSYTPPEPPEPTYYAPPTVTPVPSVLPEPAAPTYNYAGGRGTVREDTSTFNDVNDFGVHDYYAQPQTATRPEPPTPNIPIVPPEPPPRLSVLPEPPPPRPIAPDIMSPMMPPTPPPAPVAPTPIAPPVITPPAQPTAGRLVDQILAQGTTSKWTGEGFGSAEKNAADMAKILDSIGITDISQFGKITKEVPTYEYDEQGNQTQTGTQKIETFGNKLTGQEVGNTYGERQTGDAFGGTYAGKGNTGYRVQFDDKGNPYFYTSGQSSSDAAQWMPIVQLALAATGAGGLLGNALLGAGAGAVATNALGNAIISGALTGAQGGNVLKGAALGAAGGALGGYLQGATPTTPGGSLFGGAIDGSTINFADLADTDVINALKDRGLSNIQITDFLENAGGISVPANVINGSTVNFSDLADTSIVDALKERGLTNIQINDFLENAGGTVTGPAVPTSTTPVETVNVTGSAATTPVVPTMIDPNILAAVTTQLNTNTKTPVPEVKITGDKVTKPDDTTTPTVTVTGDKPVTPVVPTVTVTGDKPTTPTVPTVEVVGDKPTTPTIPTVTITGDKPVTPVVPTVEVVAPRPPVVPPVVPPVIPEIVITPPPVPPVPPVVPPVTPPVVVVPPVVLPPPKPPKPPIVVPPPPPPPPVVTNGRGLNPGLIETTPFYNTTNDAQSKYYWGDHGFQAGPTFDAASYNAVAAPDTPFGAQGVARSLSAADYENIIMGRPFTPEQFAPATRTQAYNPALLQTPVGQLGAQGNAVTGPVAPTTNYTMNPAEIQQISAVLGPALAQALAQALAAGDMETVNNIKGQYEYALMSAQNQGGGGDGGSSGGGGATGGGGGGAM